jgi:hypothetical protein
MARGCAVLCEDPRPCLGYTTHWQVAYANAAPPHAPEQPEVRVLCATSARVIGPRPQDRKPRCAERELPSYDRGPPRRVLYEMQWIVVIHVVHRPFDLRRARARTKTRTNRMPEGRANAQGAAACNIAHDRSPELLTRLQTSTSTGPRVREILSDSRLIHLLPRTAREGRHPSRLRVAPH